MGRGGRTLNRNADTSVWSRGVYVDAPLNTIRDIRRRVGGISLATAVGNRSFRGLSPHFDSIPHPPLCRRSPVPFGPDIIVQ